MRRNPLRDLQRLIKHLDHTDQERREALVRLYPWAVAEETGKVPPEWEDKVPRAQVSPIAKTLNEGDVEVVLANLFNYGDIDIPLWLGAKVLALDVQHGWVFHQTKFADQILDEGFVRGVPTIKHLLTSPMIAKGGNPHGYNFGYRPGDLDTYGYRPGVAMYGPELVVFQTDYVPIWHFLDEEPQAVFWGPDVGDVYHVVYGDWGYAAMANGAEIEAETSEELGDALSQWITGE